MAKVSAYAFPESLSKMKIPSNASAEEIPGTGDSVLFWSFFILLLTYAIEGPLRYMLVTAGFPNVIYLRDGIAVASIFFVFFRSLLIRNWIESDLAIIGGILLFHLLLGLFMGLPLFQTFFGLKIFMSFLFGVAICPILLRRFPSLLKTLAFFFLLSVSGVFINDMIGKFPWEGINYETAFGMVSGTREWWGTGGVRRLPGLSRTSFDAAMIIGISGLASLILFEHWLVRLIVAVTALTAIFLTTTKGMFQAFVILSLWMLFKNKPAILFPSGRLLVLILLAMDVAFPLIAVFFDVGNVFKEQDVPALFGSLWDRISWMWPNAFALMAEPINYVLGCGLGSIGTPQSYGLDLRQVNAADNIFVFAFVMFGPLSLLYLSYPAWQAFYPAINGNIAVWRIGFLIICYGYGVTTNMIEQPFFSALLGMVISCSSSNNCCVHKCILQPNGNRATCL